MTTRRRARLAFAASASLLGACVAESPRPQPPVTVLRHVTVVEPTDSVARAGMTVVISGTRIAALGADDAVRVPRGATVVDGTGAFVIPGLWDMHVHTVGRDFDEVYAPLLLAHGVTGVRDMGDDVATQVATRARVRAGTLVAPRLVTSARVDGAGDRQASYATVVRAPGDAARIVDSLAALGVDLVKVYGSLDAPTYAAVARAAVARGIPFAGHVPRDVTLRDALAAGQRSIEHTDDLEFACTSRELPLKRAYGGPSTATASEMLAVVRRVAAGIRAARSIDACRAVTDAFLASGAWLTPTLVVYQPYARGFGPSVTGNLSLRWVPRAQRRRWEGRANAFFAEDTATVRAFFDLFHVAALHVAGVPLLVGTDTPLPYVVPGVSVHDELALLVRAGLSPREALAAATTNPARYLRADTLGVIRAGAVADLVLLDANPLDMIANTRRIRAVVAHGRLFPRAALDSMLASVARIARR